MPDEPNGSNWAENANVLAPVSAAGPLAPSQRPRPLSGHLIGCSLDMWHFASFEIGSIDVDMTLYTICFSGVSCWLPIEGTGSARADARQARSATLSSPARSDFWRSDSRPARRHPPPRSAPLGWVPLLWASGGPPQARQTSLDTPPLSECRVRDAWEPCRRRKYPKRFPLCAPHPKYLASAMGPLSR